ncbi:MAG: copper oxidase [Pseudonocardiales bacterium]|nr:MAG: copper oxidase [Pseudonocardiales bacterium]
MTIDRFRNLPDVTRRQLLLGGATLGTIAAVGTACGDTKSPQSQAIGPRSAAVGAAERRRRRSGARIVSYQLVAQPAEIDLGAGITVATWAYGGGAPGPTMHARAGDMLHVVVRNRLPVSTTVHWHGIALRNDMDGVPGITQKAIPAGRSMTYEFTAPDPGTYWFHSHVGTQLDRGLYGPLILDDPTDRGDYDVEHIVVLDDWLDGTGRTPDQVLANLKANGMGVGMGGMSGGGHSGGSMPGMAMSQLLGGDAGDVRYPHYLVNGRVPTAPTTLNAKPGQRIRLRLINASADTAYRVALGGHQVTVTHTDGYPVEPVTADALLIGMAERYDVTVTVADGIFPLVASAEGKRGQGLALLRTASGAPPAATVHPPELDRRVLTQEDLHATDSVQLPSRTVDRTHNLELGGDMASYRWTINGRTYDHRQPLPVRQGERVRLRFTNKTRMFHPMHVHGHTFQIRNGSQAGPRKDTVIVPPSRTVVADLNADNPGQWLTHCHNVYHQEAGMMTVLSYGA